MPIVMAAGKVPKSKIGTPVVGFALDEYFVLTESKLRCRAANDNSKSYALASEAADKAHTESAGLLCSAGSNVKDVLVKDAHEALAVLVKHIENGPNKRAVGDHINGDTEAERRLMHVSMGAPFVPDAKSVAEAGLGYYTTSNSGTAKSFPDASNNYVTGTRKVLVIPIIPSDGAVNMNQPYGYNYQLIASAHGGDVRSYYEQVSC